MARKTIQTVIHIHTPKALAEAILHLLNTAGEQWHDVRLDSDIRTASLVEEVRPGHGKSTKTLVIKFGR